MADEVYGFSVDQTIPEQSSLIIDPTPQRLWGLITEAQAGILRLTALQTKREMFSWPGPPVQRTTLQPPGHTSKHMLALLMASWQNSLREGNAYGTHFGGTDLEDVLACVVSKGGTIYVSGDTKSTSGIASISSHQPNYGGGEYDCYIEKFNQAGERLWGPITVAQAMMD